MAARKRLLSAQDDLAESKRRAKAARTPIAKAVTKQVVEKKERAYSGQAPREAKQVRRNASAASTGIPLRKKPAANAKRAASKGR
jgi:hypothetical protein